MWRSREGGGVKGQRDCEEGANMKSAVCLQIREQCSATPPVCPSPSLLVSWNLAAPTAAFHPGGTWPAAGSSCEQA